jgi:RimJ/RimL family protein N-acetyltransferase
MLAVLEKDGGGFLGRAGLKHWPHACVEWAFSRFEMPYLTAMISPGNDRSIQVAERLGMSPLREDVLLDEPVVVYALERQWPRRRRACEVDHVTGI